MSHTYWTRFVDETHLPLLNVFTFKWNALANKKTVLDYPSTGLYLIKKTQRTNTGLIPLCAPLCLLIVEIVAQNRLPLILTLVLNWSKYPFWKHWLKVTANCDPLTVNINKLNFRHDPNTLKIHWTDSIAEDITPGSGVNGIILQCSCIQPFIRKGYIQYKFINSLWC